MRYLEIIEGSHAAQQQRNDMQRRQADPQMLAAKRG